MNNEYDPATSIYTPQQSGVYSILSSVGIDPTVLGTYVVELDILVNGSVRAREVEEELGTQATTVTVSSILQLLAGDEVTITISTTQASAVTVPGITDTNFEAARFPS
ncbi:ABC transporter permease [Viridibacillus soli]|uniref:ABC transporter permease n=1 Tax=Viridibacillus soli TaxID=2798301 RepID=UPI001F15FF43|nr:ABC transporter permease [Viridibacillus soli]